MPIEFKKATRKQAKLRLAISGPSGSGKTYGALLLAQGISGNIAVIDTERGSASLYSHMGEFDALELSKPFSPERYVEAIDAGAAHVGPDGVLIIDSLSHEWVGPGGCLEINEVVAKTQTHGNTWAAWAITGARHQKLLDAILNAPCHIIATLRSKTETAQVEEKGRKKVVKLGMKNETRDGAEYEFTVVLDIIHDGHYATASKDRTGLFGGDPEPLTKGTGERLKTWLESGAAPVEESKPAAILTGAQPTTEPDSPTTDDSMELIELDIGDAVSPDDYRALANRLAAVKKRDGRAATFDGLAAEALRQRIYKLGREAADALREEAA